jgi:tetratricopeptide (TPR) repeat protein
MLLSVDIPSHKEPKSEPKPWAGSLKVVAAIGATISFLLGLNQFTGLVQNFRIHHKEFREAMEAGEQAEKRQDYRAAFQSLKRAIDLDPIDRKAQERQTEAAMLWLENVHATQEHSFTETANVLLPVFDNALIKAKGSAAADILAHIGWANYLRYREGSREGVTVEGNYRQALEKDPNNAYAHAMWGFWILWQGGTLDAANAHFSAALAAGQHKDYVRRLQLAALHNSQNDVNDAALIRAANEMRKNGEPMSDEQRHSILWDTIAVRISNHDRLVALLSVLPADEMQATYDWLNAGESGSAESKKFNGLFIAANLREIAGDPAQALSMYRTLQGNLKGTSYTLGSYVDAAIKRLSVGQRKIPAK